MFRGAERGCKSDYNQCEMNVSTRPAGACEITVNGERRNFPGAMSVSQLIELLGTDPARVAVELDRRIVKRADWSATLVGDGATVEIVQFVGGG
jgi:thiamine biosynthesis protein ThiS